MIKTYYDLKSSLKDKTYKSKFFRKIESFKYLLLGKLEFCALKRIDFKTFEAEKPVIDVIVSLTSFPARINIIHYTIETILNQTVKPKKLILWLSDEELKQEDLPENLTKLQKYGLEIRWCKNLYPHKKYFFTLKEFPDSNIVTMDDDVIYPEDFLEKLYNKHIQFPDTVICNYGKQMCFYENGEILPYNKWKYACDFGVEKPEFSLFPVGVGGVLYPAGCFSPEIFNEEALSEMTLKTDDIWLKFMSLLKGTPAIRVSHNYKTLTVIPSSQKIKLSNENVVHNKNDISFKKMFNAYPEVKELLLKKL